jgi:hypothetical protein
MSIGGSKDFVVQLFEALYEAPAFMRDLAIKPSRAELTHYEAWAQTMPVTMLHSTRHHATANVTAATGNPAGRMITVRGRTLGSVWSFNRQLYSDALRQGAIAPH